MAAETARLEAQRTQQQVVERSKILVTEREALAAKDKLGAEMEARQAAKAKAGKSRIAL